MTGRVLAGAALALGLATGGCSFERKSESYSCEPGDDCGPGRTCDLGWCVEIGDGDSGPLFDADPNAPDAISADAIDCPPGCSSCEAGTCIIVCDGADSCATEVMCPTGIPCRVECSGSGSCMGGVDCSAAASCDIECTQQDSCAGRITCSAGNCLVNCTGDSSCAAGTECAASCACVTNCASTACVAPSACPAGNGCTNGNDDCKLGGPCHNEC